MNRYTNTQGGSSSSTRAPGTVAGIQLYDSAVAAGAIARGQPLCALMRILFASCSTVIPPSIAQHLELDSPFLFLFFCRLAEIPGAESIDALALARGDREAFETAVEVIRAFIGCDSLADVCLEAAASRGKRLRLPEVFRFQDIISSTASSSGSPRKQPKFSPVAPPPKSNSVPNAFTRSGSSSNRNSSLQKRSSSRRRHESDHSNKRSRSLDSGR